MARALTLDTRNAARELAELAEGVASVFPGAADLAADCAALLAAPDVIGAEEAHAHRLNVSLAASALATHILTGMAETDHPAGESDGPFRVAGLLMLGAAVVIGGRAATRLEVN